jgi:hypothetical protein
MNDAGSISNKPAPANSSGTELTLLPEQLESLVFSLRGHRVMLSSHLAELYGVEVRALVQAVKRNIERFPSDFMFQLTEEEFADLRSQFVIANPSMVRFPPYAFTEQGVAMLSSVLRSPRAIAANIEIMRTFVRLRRLLAKNKELAQRLDELESKTDQRFRVVFDAIRQLMTPPAPKQGRIGFRQQEEEQ